MNIVPETSTKKLYEGGYSQEEIANILNRANYKRTYRLERN